MTERKTKKYTRWENILKYGEIKGETEREKAGQLRKKTFWSSKKNPKKCGHSARGVGVRPYCPGQ